MAIYPWYGSVIEGKAYNAAEFLEAHTYTNLKRYTDEISQRPAVKRGRMSTALMAPNRRSYSSDMTQVILCCALRTSWIRISP